MVHGFKSSVRHGLMENVFRLLGEKWVFEGWYDDGELHTVSRTSTIVMLGPHFLIARWATDYTLPLVFFAALAVAVLAIVRVLKRKGSGPTTRKTSRRSRRRSRASHCMYWARCVVGGYLKWKDLLEHRQSLEGVWFDLTWLDGR